MVVHEFVDGNKPIMILVHGVLIGRYQNEWHS